MKRLYLRVIILTVIFGMGTGCSPFKPPPRWGAETGLPKTYSIYAPGEAAPEKWWEDFNDPELNTLVAQALSDNLTLAQAWARLDQARAIAVQAGSALYPQMDATAGASITRRKVDGRSDEIQDYFLGVVASYELDLWGRIHSEREAARLQASATREDLNTVAITLAAEVTQRWAGIISQRMQKRLLEAQLETNRILLELVELRYRKAMVSALDVFQQKQIVDQVSAQIPLVEAREQVLRHELAVLLGELPLTELEITRETLPLPVGIPATGLPAELLASRPDIRAAGTRLQSADWQVAAARADRLPAVRLSAEATYSGAAWNALFDGWLLSLAGNLSAPILDGKRRAAEVQRTRAVVDENLAFYRETVITAVREVEDALVNEAKQREHIDRLESQMEAARNALDQALFRYRNGISDYLPVLTQLLAVQSLERDLIQRQTELLLFRVSLYRALGGTWPEELNANA